MLRPQQASFRLSAVFQPATADLGVYLAPMLGNTSDSSSTIVVLLLLFVVDTVDRDK